LISQKTAISKIFDLSDEESQAEIDLISQEQNINGIINGTVPQNLNNNITL
jgi:hypothetical protein